MGVTLNDIYSELTKLKKEVETIKSALIPEEELSEEEMEEINNILSEMKRGDRIKFEK